MPVKRRTGLCYCRNLCRAAGMVTELYNGLLRPTGLSASQYSILVNLSRLGQSTVTELAGAVSLERTTLVRNLKPLFDRGYIADMSNAGARDKQICLTPSGQETVSAARPLWEQGQRVITEKLGEENMNKLSEILALLLG